MTTCDNCKNTFIKHTDIFHKTVNENEYHCMSCCINFIEQNDPIFCPNKNCMNNLIGLDGLTQCYNCGNIWDGFAQCTCLLYDEEDFLTQDTEIMSQDTIPYIEELEETFDELEETFDELEETFEENQMKPPKLVRQNAIFITK